MHRASFRGLGLALLLLVATLVATAAQAHDYLVSSTPEQGATLDAPPTQVSVEFNTSIGERFAQVAVVGPDGTTYQQGDPVVDGPRVTQAVAPIPAGSTVTISYRVVSSDGHPIGGTVGFTVAEQAGDTSPDDPVATAQPTPTDVVEPAAVTDSATGGASETDGDGSTPIGWLIALFAASAVLAGLATFVVSRRRSRSKATQTQLSEPADPLP
jgi:copper resistance protein C